MDEQGTLSVVATPIGNLEDITYRAVRVFGEVAYILCEDTRVTGKLLKHYNISTPMKRYDAHSTTKLQDEVCADLQAGKHIALCSDAGTPGVSDPGVHLIGLLHERNVSVQIVAVPGASAVTAAFSIAGITGNQFAFLGFVPQKKGRETFFKSLRDFPMPVIFFESTHRILKTLSTLSEVSPDARIYMGRELTKMHEEMLIGTAAELLEILESQPVKQKGEFVLIVTTG